MLDYFEKDWDSILKIQMSDVNLSFDNFIESIDELLDNHAPYTRLSKQKQKFKTKPWIIPGLQIAIKKKNTIFCKFIHAKNKTIKESLHEQYKEYRNLISTLLKQSKKNHYNDYFTKNASNLKLIWKGIKDIISLKFKSNSSPSSLYHRNRLVTEPKELADILMITSALLLQRFSQK